MNKDLYIIIAFFGTQTAFAQQSFSTGLDFDDAAYATMPVKKQELSRSYEKLPLKVDLKPFCPTPQLQGDYGTCVGWAIGYAACTISEGVAKNIQHKNTLNSIASSPIYVYTVGKSEQDKQCKKGAKIHEVLGKLKNTVIPRHQKFNDQCVSADKLPKNVAEGVQISDFTKLFQEDDDWKQKLNLLKKSLSDKKPIVIGISCYKSLTLATKIWSGKQDDYMGGHAVCLTGYDDAIEGGAVEIMNSWGEKWGEKGFTMVRYRDLEAILKYAYEFKTDFNPNSDKSTPSQTPIFGSSIQLKLETNDAIMPILLQNDLTKTVRNAQSNPSDAIRYKTLQSYASGTKYRCYIDLTEPTYLYVLSTDLKGHITKLFPADATMSAYIANPNAHIALPDEKWYIELDQTKGIDYTIFLYSKTAQPIDTLLTQWNRTATAQTAMEKISKTYRSVMQPFKDLNLAKNQISFRTTLNLKNIILINLEMEHR